MERVKIRDAIAGMTLKEKAAYFWTYYKWVLVVLAVAVFFLCTAVTGIRNKQTETLYSGTLVNIELTEEGTAFLSDDWLRFLGGAEKQNVELTSTFFKNSALSDPEMDSVAIMRVMASVISQELDYAIMNQIGYDYYKDQTVFASLEETVSPEILAQFDENIVHEADAQTGEILPLAIEITDWAFVKDCVRGDEKVYLAFCGNTGRTARNDTFLSYLLSWE